MPALLAPVPPAAPPAVALALPAVAVQTDFSVLEGSCSPEVWAPWVAGREVRTILADRDDLAGLPAAILAWGRERIAVGALVRLGDDDADDALLLAPDAAAYGRLCRFLSWRHEQPEAATTWLAGGRHRPDLEAVPVLATSTRAAGLAAGAGAEVHPWWRDDRAPAVPGPEVAIPLLAHRGPADQAGDAIRAAVARREGRIHAPGGTAGGDAELAARFAAHPGAVAAGRALVERCTFVPGGTWHMPPSHHPDADGELRRRALAGLDRRYGSRAPAAVRERLDHELAVIAAKGFSGYILTVADLCAGRRTCGRGSGASSLVCFVLGITHVDPVRYQLLFERFLNPARTDPPDLDVDFPWDERDAVLTEALRSYGRERVAMVATHQRLRRWGALRVAARAYGRSDEETTRIRGQLSRSMRFGTPFDPPEPWPAILAQAGHLHEVPHHMGLHCGGIVITPGPLRELAVLHPAAKRIDDPDDEDGAATMPMPTLGWEKDGAEAMGLVKIDLLGNRSLAVVRDCLADLAEDGIAIDEARWRPADDPATRAVVARGATLGCFYIESPAMRQLQAKAGSGDFDRLVVHSSIIRPAANRWITDYLERLHTFTRTRRHDPAWYPHPALRGLLSDSFGILSYQEDVMLAAIRIAGFDDRQANALRKALGHWNSGNRIAAFAKEFASGARARGVDETVIGQVWGNIASFAGYSFCKAHSASYAMVSFQCAYLKTHHPAHFLARVVANEGGFYAPAAYLEEARRLGVRILAPCLLASGWTTVREGADAIRLGLHLVPGLGRTTGERILRERERRPFTGLRDLRRRTGVLAGTLDTLARAGALDALAPGRHRGQLQWLAAAAGLDGGRRVADEDDDGALRIVPLEPLADPEPPALPAPTPRQAAWDQFRALGGISPAGHPIWFCRDPRPPLRARDLTADRAGQPAVITAWPITRKEVDAHPKAAPGRTAGPPEPMAFVTLEDETGLVETVWFPAAWRRYGPLVEQGGPLRLAGTIEAEHGFATLTVDHAEPVEAGG